MSIRVEPVSLPTFGAEGDEEEGEVKVRLTGSAEMGTKEHLDAFLGALHPAAVRAGAREVVLDLRELEFMNSSCFKSMISWITTLKETDEARRYKIRIVSNPNMHWQKRSLHALKCFAADLIDVVTDDPA